MENSWANIHPERDATGPVGSGLDLHVELAGPRVRASVETALRQAVQTGRLAAGTRLPASRTLASDLGVARNTVADVYGQLVAEGWLTARQGSGTRVAEHPAAEPPAAGPAATAPEPGKAPRYSLKSGLPDLSEFPRTAWLAASRKAVTAAPRRAFGYGDPRGQPALRSALAAYLARARGVRAAADQIVICSGFTQGLSLLGRVLAGSGAAAVGVEAYGHAQHREVIEAAGLSALPVPVDPLGAVIGQVPEGCAALLLTPAHQFPLGVALAPARRQQAVAWAAGNGAVVIEDDYDGEFRYDRRAIGAMQALAPEHVIYAGTASKTLAPAIRLGWLAVPRRMLDDVLATKEHADRHGSSLDELTLAEFIGSGAYDRHVRRSRLRYQRRRDLLIVALARALPGQRVTGVAAGLHAVLHLPPGVGEDEIVTAAAARGLVLDGMRSYRRPGNGYPEALVIGFGTPPEHAFTTAVSRLCAVLRAGQPISCPPER